MALLLRTGEPITLVGYAPRYYSGEFTQVINSTELDQVKVTVEQVNSDAPIQYRVLCRLGQRAFLLALEMSSGLSHELTYSYLPIHRYMLAMCDPC